MQNALLNFTNFKHCFSMSRFKMVQLKSYSSNLLLPLLTLICSLGELGHFLIGVVSRSMAQNIGYGDKSCLVSKNAEGVSWEFCREFESESGCVSVEYGNGNMTAKIQQPCDWNFNGLGTEYQVLAGPSYMACFTTSGIVFGIVADKMNRVYLLGVATFFSGVVVAGTAFATQYWHLVLFRMTLAAAAAACTPLAAGMIGDVYPQNKLALAMGIFNIGIYFGFGLSFAVGSYITDTTIFNESWRTCFLVCGIPGIFIAIIFMLTVKDPRQTEKLTVEAVEMQENGQLQTHNNVKEEIKKNALLRLFTRPEIIMLVTAAFIRHSAGFCWAYNSSLYFQTYYPDFDAGWWLTGISIGAGVLGCIVGGHISDRLVRRLGISARTLVLAASQLISTPFTVLIFYLEPPYTFLALFAATMTSEMWFGVMYAILVELVPPNLKSTAVAVALFVINNVGGNLPILVGPLTQATDFRTSILIMDPGFLLASSVLFFTCWILLRRRAMNLQISI